MHAPEEIHTFGEMATKATQVTVEHGFATEGDRIAITAGVPFATPGTTNVLRLVTIDKAMMNRRPSGEKKPEPATSRAAAKSADAGAVVRSEPVDGKAD